VYRLLTISAICVLASNLFTFAQSRSFACIGPSLWNGLPPSLHSTNLCDIVSLALSVTLKPSFSLGISRTGGTSERLMLWEALYKGSNTIQYLKAYGDLEN